MSPPHVSHSCDRLPCACARREETAMPQARARAVGRIIMVFLNRSAGGAGLKPCATSRSICAPFGKCQHFYAVCDKLTRMRHAFLAAALLLAVASAPPRKSGERFSTKSKTRANATAFRERMGRCTAWRPAGPRDSVHRTVSALDSLARSVRTGRTGVRSQPATSRPGSNGQSVRCD